MTQPSAARQPQPASVIPSVIPAGREHLSDMTAIFVEGQRAHVEAFPDIFEPPEDLTAISRYLAGFLPGRNPWRTRRNFALVWIVENRARGMILYEYYQTQSIFFRKGSWLAFVLDIAIAESHRRQGGAQALFSAFNDHIAARPPTIVSGQVWNGNDASVALFERQGFDARSKHFFKVLRN